MANVFLRSTASRLTRLLAAASSVLVTAPAACGVAVIANQTGRPVSVVVATPSGRQQSATIESGSSVPLFSNEPITLSYRAGVGLRSERLTADAIYRFTGPGLAAGPEPGTGVELRRIGLMGDLAGPPNDAAWRVGAGAGDAPVRVLLCVDDDEPTRETVWRDRLADRLSEASEILEAHSGVRFEAVGYARWQSNNRLVEFEQTLAEFERSVDPRTRDADLAIGFTSQYRVSRGRHRMGGTRGPLRRHVVVREWSPRLGEAERVELLVHELGHYLGAAHSPEPTSVMRPVLGNLPVRLRDRPVRFDPVNTLAVAMVGDEVRRRNLRAFAGLSNARRERLARVYATLAALTPGDPAAAALLLRAGGVAEPDPEARGTAGDAVAALTAAASRNNKRPRAERAGGDALAELLVRAAAGEAADGKAFLLAIGVGLDDSGALAKAPGVGEAARRVESTRERGLRLNVLGKPTARGRADTLKHFAISAALVAAVGEKRAATLGVAKELLDANGGTGFSFADLAANRAGRRFARSVLAGETPLAALADGFRVANFVPSLDELPEGLTAAELAERYGVAGDARYDAVIEEIDRRIDALPPHALRKLDLGL